MPGWSKVTWPLAVAAALALTVTAPRDGGAAERPKAHFSVANPAELTGSDALNIYKRLIDGLARGYSLSGDPRAARYATWRRFNKTPYRSATHGNRFVNNYANALGKAYGKFEQAGELSRGAVVAKDSFAVTDGGEVFSGPLFLMEKMAPGFNPTGRDWRYSMIMPDGSLFGTTGGEGAERVEFCMTCHRTAGEARDHLFFLPEEFR